MVTKEDWITALRSGKYSQAKGCLKNENSFCCLGVLCDIYPDSQWELNNKGKPDCKINGKRYVSHCLPVEIIEKNNEFR